MNADGGLDSTTRGKGRTWLCWCAFHYLRIHGRSSYNVLYRVFYCGAYDEEYYLGCSVE